MNKLEYQILQICKRNRDGSQATQSNRRRILAMCTKQLADAGFKVNKINISDLKGRHIDALLNRWRSDGISTGAIKNRLSALRWLAEKVGDEGLVKSNDVLGIEKRQYIKNEDKGVTLSDFDISQLDKNTQLSLRLQAAFGLRRSEALKFQISYALGGYNIQNAEKIRLKASWTKGGRYREVPIATDSQRQLLAEVASFCQANDWQSLIAPNLAYKEQLKCFEAQTSSIGLGNTHGLRHRYAQERYRRLSGMEPPVIAGQRRLTASEREIDHKARMCLTEELGHGRKQITSQYLGSWGR
ncbi:integrase [Moraxella caviae]|nr:phage integrase N-terminal domain-containing protein [Moraxella caviae]OOR87520.1 integrase [Moraxella caviae]